jgi:2,3-bisphosphoglycerate-dependent phosphoglycerate mutase
MTDLYLIRHGEFVMDMPFSSVPPDGPPLSPLGIIQAERLRDRLAGTREIRADILISSPLQRARQTAEIIAPALGLPLTLDEDFQEFRIGDRSWVSAKEIIAKYGMVDFEQEPSRPVAPGGESWSQFTARVSGAFERAIHAYDGKTIVIVCHDGIIALSFLHFFGLEALKFVKGIFRPAFAQLYTNTTSITYWHKSHFHDVPQEQEPQWMLVRYNDDVHLYDIGLPDRIPWQQITPRFSGGPGLRPVQVKSSHA